MEISGDSPTDIFIGRYGYPKVFIGPLVPPVFGDTDDARNPGDVEERPRYRRYSR